MAIVQPHLIAICSLIDKTLRMRNEIQVWLSIICKTLQQSLTKALEILRRATTQFLNRTPTLIREASQFPVSEQSVSRTSFELQI